MNRRSLLKLLTLGVAGLELDIDRLLWVPGSKTIFLPPATKQLTLDEIVALEIKRLLPTLVGLFERSDLFYNTLKSPVRIKVSNDFVRDVLKLKEN